MSSDALTPYPFPRETAIDPPSALMRMSAERAVHPVRLDGVQGMQNAWLVTRYETVRSLLSDSALGTQYPGVAPSEDPDDMSLGFMFLKDPPEHTRLRRAVSRAFTAKTVSGLRERVQEVADHLVDEMVDHGPPAELLDMLAFPLPIAVIADLLGVPDVDRERFRRWSNIVLRGVESDPEAVGTAFSDLQRFIVDLVDGKPDGDDLLSALVRDQLSGEGLSRREVYSMALGLLMAGYVTTSAAIAVGTVRLLETGDFEELGRGRLETRRVVEELLRFQDEERGLQRIAQRDIVVEGTTIQKGDTVICSRAAANRDSAVFARAESFDPTRSDAGGHLTFGHGPHHCLGASLARMEMEIALGTLAARLPRLRLTVPSQDLEWTSDGMDVSFYELNVEW